MATNDEKLSDTINLLTDRANKAEEELVKYKAAVAAGRALADEWEATQATLRLPAQTLRAALADVTDPRN